MMLALLAEVAADASALDPTVMGGGALTLGGAVVVFLVRVSGPLVKFLKAATSWLEGANSAREAELKHFEDEMAHHREAHQALMMANVESELKADTRHEESMEVLREISERARPASAKRG